MKKLKRVEFLGGPLDGKMLTIPVLEPQYHYNVNPLVQHIYVPDEQQTGKGVRTVYRHFEARPDPLLTGDSGDNEGN